MVDVLNVAEKPAAAKKIAIALSGGNATRINSHSVYNSVFKFPYCIQGQQCNMIVTSVTGHLMKMDFVKDFRSWGSCEPDLLFDDKIPVEMFVDTDQKPIELNLHNLAKNAQQLILWLDGDREGENISFEVIRACKQVNPRLDLKNRSNFAIKRAKFSDLTPASIKRAIENLIAPNQLESDSVNVRREIDLRIGAAFTRFQTQRFQQKFEGLEDNLLSYGSCQFPTLGFIVRRYQRHVNFVPQQFWKINLSVEKDSKNCHFLWQRNRLYDRKASVILYEMVVEAKEAEIVSVQKKPTSNRKPLPLNTVEMTKMASRYLKFGAQKTMTIAEELYNQGLISYPRTETDSFTFSDDHLLNLVKIQEINPHWGQYAASLSQNKFQRPRGGRNNDNAHPPIHPVKIHTNDLQPDHMKLYELISRHFLASCSKDAFGNSTNVTARMGGEFFRTSGLMIEGRNWLEVFPWMSWSSRDIPIFEQGQKFEPKTLTLEDGMTCAPSLLTESELIGLMDKNGIGTDATIAQHIQTIQQRHYVRKVGSHFEPTNLGLGLVEGYTEMKLDLSRPQLRAKIESDVNDIVTGRKTKEEVLLSTLTMYKKIFQTALRKKELLDNSMKKYFKPLGTTDSAIKKERFSKCGKCNEMMSMYETGKSKKRFLKCNKCEISYSLPQKSKFKAHEQICPYCQFQAITVQTAKKTTYQICPFCYSTPPDIEEAGTQKMPCFKCNNPSCSLSQKIEGGKMGMCPQCSQELHAKKSKSGKWFIGCSGFAKGCTTTLWMPSYVSNIEVSSAKCGICQSCIVELKLNGGMIGLERDVYKCCIFCSKELRENPDFAYKGFNQPRKRHPLQSLTQPSRSVRRKFQL